MIKNESMVHRVIFTIASLVIFFVLDQYWLFPLLFGNLPNLFGWGMAALVAVVELLAIFAEWVYL